MTREGCAGFRICLSGAVLRCDQKCGPKCGNSPSVICECREVHLTSMFDSNMINMHHVHCASVQITLIVSLIVTIAMASATVARHEAIC